MDKQMLKDSKYLSYLLRHNPEEVGCTMDIYGWVDVNKLIKNSFFTFGYLKEIVDNDTRYTFSDDYKKIRAYHGHSRKVIYQNEVIPPDVLYHGTSKENYELILQFGSIRAMDRVQVHLSDSIKEAKKIGKRHSHNEEPVVIKIDCKKMYREGYTFFKSEDGVYLTSNISIDYFIND